MMSTVRAAMTQTVNAYPDMPATVKGLRGLKRRLDAVRGANVEHNVGLIRGAAALGAKVVGLGELCTGPYFAMTKDPMWLGLAEDAADGPSVGAFAEAARENKIVVVAPIYELDAKTKRRFNTAVIIEADGTVLGKYRKTHIPCGANEQGEFAETYYYGRSEGPQNRKSARILGKNPYFPVFKTSVGKIGAAICYDRHFEGVVAALAEAGAELVFSPAVTFGAKSRRLWEQEFLVDACRHRLFLGGSNRRGAEKPWNQPYFGASYFAGPDGEKVSNRSPRPDLVIADLDLASLKKPDPSGWDLKRDVRPGIY
ncbi:MAG: nitrilase-related carbon-nitrogen hydrolase [Elusimicrobiota bacterium]|nr:nitrilase-related carbon-nitrogen hydrolase [Elusimicrobiota bacterium]